MIKYQFMKTGLFTCIIICIISLGFASCGNGDTRPLVDPGAASTVPPMPASPTTVNDSTSLFKSQSTVALNPKHGLPGHRCDIPEGAPLNTAAGSQAPAVNMKQPAGTARLNPQHGAPGHRCDIAVGAPL
jgi:hypothetical protein